MTIRDVRVLHDDELDQLLAIDTEYNDKSVALLNRALAIVQRYGSFDWTTLPNGRLGFAIELYDDAENDHKPRRKFEHQVKALLWLIEVCGLEKGSWSTCAAGRR